MADKVIHDCYRQLAAASIIQGVNDYLGDKKMDDYALYSWIQECDYFDHLGIDRDYFYVKVINMRRKGIRKISNYGERKSTREKNSVSRNE